MCRLCSGGRSLEWPKGGRLCSSPRLALVCSGEDRFGVALAKFWFQIHCYNLLPEGGSSREVRRVARLIFVDGILSAATRFRHEGKRGDAER